MNKKLLNRTLSVFLAVCMLMAYLPMDALASGTCEHHSEHTEGCTNEAGECVYECADCAASSAPCTHSNTSDWYIESAAPSNHTKLCYDCYEYIRQPHTGGTANCHYKAICDVCTYSYGEVDLTKHQPGEWEFNSSERHFRQCSICQKNATIEYENHNGGTATCSTLAICEGCGVTYGTYAEDVHGEMTQWKNYDSQYHLRYCSGCGNGEEKEVHSEVWRFDDENHYLLCEVCNEISYVVEHFFSSDCDSTCNIDCGYTRNVSHIPEEEWSRNRDEHWHDCMYCGEDMYVENHKVGEWSRDTISHWKECSTCEGWANYGEHNYELDMDENHHWVECSCGDYKDKASHDFVWKIDEDRYWQECSCGAVKPHEKHDYQKKTNAAYHWMECSCGLQKDMAEHIPGAAATATTAQVCTACSHVIQAAFGTDDDGSVAVPISGQNDGLNVKTYVRGENAIIYYIHPGNLESAISGNVDNGIVTLDFSKLRSVKPITSAELPAAAIGQIGKVASDPNTDMESFEIRFSDGTSAAFDAAALEKLGARTGSIRFSIMPATEKTMNDVQKQIAGDRPVFQIQMLNGKEIISDMGGVITITTPYELKGGEVAEGIVVYYIDDNGNKIACETFYDAVKKCVSWKTGHLSLYMIGYEVPAIVEAEAPAQQKDVSPEPAEAVAAEPAQTMETAPAEQAVQPEQSGNGMLLPLVGIVLAGAAAVLFFVKRKAGKTEEKA